MNSRRSRDRNEIQDGRLLLLIEDCSPCVGWCFCFYGTRARSGHCLKHFFPAAPYTTKHDLKQRTQTYSAVGNRQAHSTWRQMFVRQCCNSICHWESDKWTIKTKTLSAYLTLTWREKDSQTDSRSGSCNYRMTIDRSTVVHCYDMKIKSEAGPSSEHWLLLCVTTQRRPCWCYFQYNPVVLSTEA